MFVKPREGVQTRDPVLRDMLPPEGREVQPDPYWLRRIADGDVEEAEQPPPPPAPAPDNQPSTLRLTDAKKGSR